MSLKNLKNIFQDEFKAQTENFKDNRPAPYKPPAQGYASNNQPIEYETPIKLEDSDGWSSLFNKNHSPRPISEFTNPNTPFKPFLGYKNANRAKLNIKHAFNPARTSIISTIGKLIGGLGASVDGPGLVEMGREPYIVSEMPETAGSIKGGRRINFGNRDFPVLHSVVDTVRIAKFLTSFDGALFITKQNILGRRGSFGGFIGGFFDGGGKEQKYKSKYNPLSTLAATFGAGRFGQTSLLIPDKTEPNLFFNLFSSGEYPDFTPTDTPNVATTTPTVFSLGQNAVGLGPVIGTRKKGDMIGGSALGRKMLSLGPIGPKNQLSRRSLGTFNRNTFAGNYGPFSLIASLVGIIPTIKMPIFQGSGTNQWQLKNTFNEPSPGGASLGDKMTNQAIFSAPNFANMTGSAGVSSSVFNSNSEEEKDGMPFYFKDLRDNSYIYFRAYIEGMTENISPSYASTNYIGRSEPVYVYERAEREITFTLKLAAQSATELAPIYKKMDRLTSMCYPEYVQDGYGNRMKPPLAKLRYGEYFGTRDNELMGYIKSLSYNIDNSSTYETEPGKRVPKNVNVTIGFQVIHNKVPNLETKFYGINK